MNANRQVRRRQQADEPGVCAFCKLPLPVPHSEGPLYCCYGCRFAASIAAADGDEGQARWAMTRLGLAVFFSMNVMVFTMLLWSQPAEPGGRPSDIWYELARYASLIFTLPVVLLLGGPLVEDAVQELTRRRASVSLLLAVGVLASLGYSLWSVFISGGHVYLEVTCTILVATTLGRWLEAMGKLQTTAALRQLKQLLPDQVRLLRGVRETIAPCEELRAGDRFRVLPGERVAADGLVVGHQAAVDEQVITGESAPSLRQPGDRVMSGTLVLDGPLDIQALAPADEGTLAGMIEAVACATQARSRYQRLVEQISRWFLPAAGLIAGLTFAAHLVAGDSSRALTAALAVLVIACPCALGLATPMALWAATGSAAQAGVLIRDGDALSLLARAETICFDKTGTLTTGEPTVAGFECDPLSRAEEVLRVAGALSRGANHPLAAAVSRYAERFAADEVALAQQVAVRPGRGVSGQVALVPGQALLGSRSWLAACGQELAPDWQNAPQDAASETLVAWDGQIRGQFCFRESLRPEASDTIRLLRDLGLEVWMITGDRRSRAEQLAQSLGLRVRSELLPEEKLAVLGELQADGPVIMVGDGVNDAPALASASVGIALGSGADISRHAATVCLLASDLRRLPWLVRLARQTERTIAWNLVWSFSYNVIGIGLAASGWLHPVFAAAAMAASSLLVVSNSLTLTRFNPDLTPGAQPA